MPLLYALRDNLGAARAALRLRACAMRRLHGAHRRQGGALLRHAAVVASSRGQKVVTLEGLGTPQQAASGAKAFIEEQAAQCGYCINGMIMEVGRLPRHEQEADRG